jgi:hypothetical protein
LELAFADSLELSSVDSLQPSLHKNSPTKTISIAVLDHFLLALMNSSFLVCYNLQLYREHKEHAHVTEAWACHT